MQGGVFKRRQDFNPACISNNYRRLKSVFREHSRINFSCILCLLLIMVKPKLLLVDDDKNALDGMVKLLKRYGYHVCGVESGTEALALLSRKRFDIIITDLNLPGMGGFALIQEIRKKEASTFIIVISAYASPATMNAPKYGADGYLTKPVNIEELKSVVEGLWKRKFC